MRPDPRADGAPRLTGRVKLADVPGLTSADKIEPMLTVADLARPVV